MRAWQQASDRDCKQPGTNPFLTPFNVFVHLTCCRTFGVQSRSFPLSRSPWNEGSRPPALRSNWVNWKQEELAGFDGRRQPSLGGTSRISREAYVRSCERLGVKSPGPTRRWESGRRSASALAPILDSTWSNQDVLNGRFTSHRQKTPAARSPESRPWRRIPN